MTEGSVAVGFDIGGTNVRGVALEASAIADGRVDASDGTGVRIARPRTAAGLVDVLVELTETLAAGATVNAVGVGCAGLVDRSGTVRTSPNIASLVNFGLHDHLVGRLGADTVVVVDNDATVATWAEVRAGAAVGVDDVLYVALGTGIGAGLVLAGSLYRGANGFAGEVGHMTVVEGGLQCHCGRRGCWEQYGSGTALNRLTKRAAAAGRLGSVALALGVEAEALGSEHLAAAVAEGSDEALVVLDEYAHWVALGLAGLVNLIDPSMIVIGGGVAGIGDPLLSAVSDRFAKAMVDQAFREPVEIAPARLGDGAGAIGAALLALDSI